MNQQLINFYTSDGVDHAGRTHADIMAFSNEQFESTHDIIQFLYPTYRPSAYNEHAPVLDDETLSSLKGDVFFEVKYLQSLEKFLNSLEIPYEVKRIKGVRKPIIKHIVERKNWMVFDNHILVRITRVLESSRLLGYCETSKSLFEHLLRTVKSHPEFYFISPETLYYWYRSVYGFRY
jgi:hypothetical protein